VEGTEQERRGEEKTKAQLLLEEKYDLMKNGLMENLQKKHDLELQINQQFQELKIFEISMEKRSLPPRKWE